MYTAKNIGVPFLPSFQPGPMVSPRKEQAAGLSHPLPTPCDKSSNFRQAEHARWTVSLFPYSASTYRANSLLQTQEAYNTGSIRTLIYSWCGDRNGSPLQYSCLENLVDRGAWWAAVHGVAQSWTRLKRCSMHACIGEGHGNPLQYSCLENPRDRGAWWAAIYGDAQIRTWLCSSILLVRFLNGIATLENSLVVPQEAKNRVIVWPSNCTQVNIQEKWQQISTQNCVGSFQSNIIYNNPEMPINWWMDK